MRLVDLPVNLLYGNARPLTLPGVFLLDALKRGQISQNEIDELNAPIIAEYRQCLGYTYPWGVVAERTVSGAGDDKMIALNIVPVVLWSELRAARDQLGLPITYWLTLLRPSVEAGVSRLPAGVRLSSTKTVGVTRLQHELLTLTVDPHMLNRWRSWVEYDFLGGELPTLIAAVRGRVLRMCDAARSRQYAERTDLALGLGA